MPDTNDTTVVPADQSGDTNTDTQDTSADTQQTSDTQTRSNRTALTDEEQLEILEGRAQRLRTKLGKKGPEQQSSTSDTSAALAEKGFLRSAGLATPEEQDLARSTAKKWNMPLDELVDDPDFKEKLEKHRADVANAQATSHIRGDGSGSDASQSAAFYIARGAPPTRAEVPDRKTRVAITKQMMASEKEGGKFYNEGNSK